MMKPFHQIAIPHEHIIKGKLTMDTFAADLWSVFVGKAEQKYQEYQDPEIFFERTYMTYGLNNLIKMVENRLRKCEGNSVIQLQTPFGGGKTHSLIALYHKAKEWGAKVVVLDGTVFNPEETTLWGEMERQLTGKISELATKVSPGREKLANLLGKHTPLLILLDELLEYAVRAKGVKIGDTTLAVQVAPFLQELATTVSMLDQAVLVLTLPSNISERYEFSDQILFQQLQKISGRIEKMHVPVKDEEISQVINKRLFEKIDEIDAKKNIDEYIKYLKKENIISDVYNYRDKFLRTFPFEPSVIDVLYHRWGSLPTFQRTRGVLRILAIVVNNLLRSDVPFIRLSDFDLSNEELRGELVKHVGSEYESVISADITSYDSASRKVDNSLQKFSYLKMGTKISTTIFMYSFTGDQERGPNLTELKINCSTPDIPSSIVIECLEELKKHSFYISDSGYFFTTKPNLNRIHLNKINNITDREIYDYELELIREIFRDKNSKLGNFKIYIWPSTHKDVPDNKDIKLIVMKESNENQCKEFVEKYGDRPRIYRNTLIFLCPKEETGFIRFITEKIAWEKVRNDNTLHLDSNQKRELEQKIKKYNEISALRFRECYRTVFFPSKNGIQHEDLGIPTIGIKNVIDEIYNQLKDKGIIQESISNLVIEKKYLEERDYVEVQKLVDSFYIVPGEVRIINQEAIFESIRQGIERGSFGLGVLENDQPICHFYKTNVSVDSIKKSNLVIINSRICQQSKNERYTTIDGEIETQKTEDKLISIRKRNDIRHDQQIKDEELSNYYRSVHLKFAVNIDKIRNVLSSLIYIFRDVSDLNIIIELKVDNAQISVEKYNNIRETFDQLRIKPEIEELR